MVDYHKGKTVGEEVEEFLRRYDEADEIGKKALGDIAALEHFKWDKIWRAITRSLHGLPRE